jgi:von Willebrand factor A domain-containing protein 7
VEKPKIRRNSTDFLKLLDNIIVRGGGDCPEMALTGIYEGVKYSKKKSIAFVLTDAYAKDYMRYKEVILAVNKAQTSINFILTGECEDDGEDNPGFDVYENIADKSNGQVYRLKTDKISLVLKTIQMQLDDDFSMISCTTSTKSSVEEELLRDGHSYLAVIIVYIIAGV